MPDLSALDFMSLVKEFKYYTADWYSGIPANGVIDENLASPATGQWFFLCDVRDLGLDVESNIAIVGALRDLGYMSTYTPLDLVVVTLSGHHVKSGQSNNENHALLDAVLGRGNWSSSS